MSELAENPVTAHRAAALYRWPAAAKFGRVVPKTKFYEHANIPTAVHDKFIAKVQRITWAYKLADDTIRLPGTAGVPEIQVFAVDTKNEDVSDDVLTAIDKAVPFPIIFEINRDAGSHVLTRMTAAHKQLGIATPRLSAYFTTEWQAADGPRSPLPPALDLPGLYMALLSSLLPIQARPGEVISDVIGRMHQAHKLDREIASLDKRIRAEPQFNRKVELRRQLLDCMSARAELLGGLSANTTTSNTEDVAWTN